MTLFDRAFDYLMNLEGYYSNDPDDPGGETKWGISQASFPHVNMNTLTKEQAKDIYYNTYWTKFKCDKIKSNVLAVELFVAVVNVNGQKVIKYLQESCNVLGAELTVDGLIGTKTLDWINNFPHPKAILSALEGRMFQHYVSQNKKKYISGWLIRNDSDFA